MIEYRREFIGDAKQLSRLLHYEHELYPSTDSKSMERVVFAWYLPIPASEEKARLQLIHRLANVYFNNRNGELLGFYMVLPLLETAYEDLLNGRLSELEISSEHLVTDASECSRIGLHVYHIEKLANFDSSISDMVLRDVSRVLNEFSNIEIIGWSGYCVSRSGIDLFYNKWNCYEVVSGNDVPEEHIFKDRKTGKLKVITCKRNEFQKLYVQNKDLIYLHRCKMLLTRPNQYSPVWLYLRRPISKL
jgi:hypothetical protein